MGMHVYKLEIPVTPTGGGGVTVCVYGSFALEYLEV